MFSEPVAIASVASHLYPNRKIISNDAVSLIAFSDANPFAGSAGVAFDGWQAGHWIYVDATNLDHVVTASKEVVHASKTTTAAAPFGSDKAPEISQIETNDQWSL